MNNTIDNKVISATCPNCGVTLVASLYEPVVKCHWCHTIIPASLYNEDFVLPERILPFRVTKRAAERITTDFIDDKNEFADLEFLKNFDSEKLVPVYLPFNLIDFSFHSENSGVGEKLVTRYGFAGNKRISELCQVKRNFDLSVKDIVVNNYSGIEYDVSSSFSNIVRAVSPFDTENSVEFNPNFLNGFTTEYRELNDQFMKERIEAIIPMFAKHERSNLTKIYDISMKWNPPKNKLLEAHSSTIYLPVWLYSYYHDNKVYYIGVNGRTGAVAGFIPTDDKQIKRKLTKKSKRALFIWGLFPLTFFILGIAFSSDSFFLFLFILLAIITFDLFIIRLLIAFVVDRLKIYGVKEAYSPIRKSNYIEETKYDIKNIVSVDKLIRKINAYYAGQGFETRDDYE